MTVSFSFARVPPIHCGMGTLQEITDWLRSHNAQSVLLVTGQASLEAMGQLSVVECLIKDAGTKYSRVISTGEPSTELVDRVTQQWFDQGLDAVVGIGGGSVIDFGKAIAAMLPHGNSVLDHLEGVGRGRAHSGITLPFLAIPTTSGTGGEVSKNAVLSHVGPNGYKKSLRHDNFVPNTVILDGSLLTGADADVTAACGMDAFTQLLEPFLSPMATPLSDAIVWSGLQHLVPNLRRACGEGSSDPQVRLSMAYGSLCSGIGLANAGLGIVHGLAGPIGGWFAIPHGVICGTLMAAAQQQNWSALQQRDPHHPAVERMARVGRLMPGGSSLSDNKAAVDHFTKSLLNWVEELKIPRLGSYGITAADLDRIVEAASNRNNPIALTPSEIKILLQTRL
ncbi:iron-containing alcohol dehydrogenase [Synechococcus sp. UW179A]|uniref:iron-containing alcohol dehydrogenase n=1 Tax=Synechococcus sp. UW179A TaxID=2575510 RepID=UPI000E0EA962|nr:iron-containing alcohol dehydrogenase [Synechococcus sp. UW179A]